MTRFFVALVAFVMFSLISCSDPSGIAPVSEDSEIAEEPAVTFTPRPFDPAIVRNIENAKNPPRPKIDEATTMSPGTPNLQVVDGRERALAGDLLEMPPGEAMSLAMTELVRRWASKDLDGALEFASELQDGHWEAKRSYYRGIADELARQKPEVLLETIATGIWWQDQWKPERTAVLKVSETDLDAAVSHFSNTGQNKQLGMIANHFASRIASERSVDEALAFAESLENPKARGFALRATVNEWIDTESVAATGYVDSITDPYLKSHAIRGMVESIWQTHPTETMAWALAITDAEIRESPLGQLAKNWNNDNDRDNLMKLMERNDLTNEDRAALDRATR